MKSIHRAATTIKKIKRIRMKIRVYIYSSKVLFVVRVLGSESICFQLHLCMCGPGCDLNFIKFCELCKNNLGGGTRNKNIFSTLDP